MSTNFPGSLDTTSQLDNAKTNGSNRFTSLATFQNNAADALLALEAKVGADASAVTSSLDYLLKNAASNNPGHTHSGAALTGILEANIVDGALLARVASAESISGAWTFAKGKLLDKGEIVYDVKAYGAAGDGATDDTAAINAAVAAATGGGVIFFPPGTYKVTSTIAIATAGITFAGVPGKSILSFTSSSTYLITVAADHFAMGGMYCYYNAGSAATAGGAVKLTSGGWAKLFRCTFDGGFYDNVNVVDGYGYTFLDCYFLSEKRAGIYQDSVITPDRGDSAVIGCKFDNNAGGGTAAFYWVAGGALRFIGNKILGYLDGFLADLRDGVTTSGLYIHSNSIEEFTDYAVRVKRAGTTGTLSLVQVVGNEVGAASGDGFRFESASVSRVIVVGNVLALTATDTGIAFVSGVTKSAVSANLITGALTGISIDGTSEARISRDNTFYDCTTDVSDSSSGASLRTARAPFVPMTHDSADAHGSLNAVSQITHYHLAAAADTFCFWRPRIVPEDDAGLAAGDWVLKFMWSSSAAGGNVRFTTVVSDHVDAATANVDVLNTTQDLAAPAVANTMKVSSFTFTTLPAAAAIMGFYIKRAGTHVNDTNTGQVSIWGAWAEYKRRLY